MTPSELPLGIAGLARFAADLPHTDTFITLGEGCTPLLELPRLSDQLGHRVSAKFEFLNPTGSYKDRIAAMSVSLAVAQGRAGWIATSSGNAGVAFAAYGQRAGLPGFLCIVDSAPTEKKASLVPYDTAVLAVEGMGDGGSPDAARRLMAAVADAAERHNLFLGITAHAFNPDGMRGADTIGYELAEQQRTTTHVYVPTGGGGLLVAIARGLREKAVGARVIACQPDGCAPIVRFLDRELSRPIIGTCESKISALQLPHPPDGDLAAVAVVESDGWGTAVSDEAILAAQGMLAKTEGIFVEPASATSLAALIKDLKRGRLLAEDWPVLMLTGAGWKNLATFADSAERLPRSGIQLVSEKVDLWARDLPGH